MMRGILPSFAAMLTVVPASAQSWRVAATPLTTVGSATGTPEYELAGVLGAHRFRDGKLLIANNSPLELRLYDANGRFISRIGRRGSGPGEFRGRIALRDGPGDSVRVFDDGLSRWTIYTGQATLARSWVSTSAERAALEPAQYRRTLIHSGASSISSCDRTLIDQLPTPRDSSYREVFPDGNDRVWIRNESDATWSVRSRTGRALGTVTLPVRFEILEIGDGLVVGVRRDDDGIEHVDVLAIGAPKHGATPACAARADSFPPDRSILARNLAINLRNLESAADAFRQDRGHYPATLDSLNRAANFTLSTGVTVRWKVADGTGMDAIAGSPGAAIFCRLLIGELAPVWLYRVAYCGQ